MGTTANGEIADSEEFLPSVHAGSLFARARRFSVFKVAQKLFLAQFKLSTRGVFVRKYEL